jgi:hypothetical protein
VLVGAPHLNRPATVSRAVLWASLALIVVGLAAGFVVYQSIRPWTPERVEKAVREGLPTGSAREEIESFLDRLGFPHHFYDSLHSVDATDGRVSGVTPADFGGAISAHVPNPNLGLLTGGSIRMVFYLNKNGRLIKYDLEVERLYL